MLLVAIFLYGKLVWMWTNEELVLLTEMKKQALLGLYSQSQSAYIHHIVHNCLTVPNILMGGFLSVSLFATNAGAWKIAGGVIALASTVLTGLSKHVGAAEKAQLHCLAVREYQRLIHDINMYMHSPLGQNPNEIIQALRKDMDRVIGLQPDPSLWMMQRFHNVYRTKLEKMLFHDFEKIMLDGAQVVNNRVSIQPKKQSNSSFHMIRP